MNQNHTLEEMRYFLMVYLNLDFIVCSTLVFWIVSNFSFLSTGLAKTFMQHFLKDCIKCLLNFICNHSLSLVCTGSFMEFLWTELSIHSTDWLIAFPSIELCSKRPILVELKITVAWILVCNHICFKGLLPSKWHLVTNCICTFRTGIQLGVTR